MLLALCSFACRVIQLELILPTPARSGNAKLHDGHPLLTGGEEASPLTQASQNIRSCDHTYPTRERTSADR